LKDVYLIDPYYADSHRYWADQLVNNLNARVRIFQRSPVNWKWRMEGGAIDLAKEINQIDNIPETFLVTDYLNLSLFKCLLESRFLESRFVIYMHENQLTYPFSEKDSDVIKNRDSHYGFINYTSCLVADAIIFNSQYHQTVFFDALHTLSQRLPDSLDINLLKNKSQVIPLTINTENFKIKLSKSNTTKNIIWNHRWDYDKRPDVFLDSMVQLKENNLKFNLILLGRIDKQTQKQYANQFEKLKESIIHFGFAESRNEYLNLLAKGNIIISTSIHDFFGLSVLEGIYAGCRPVLPHDLAYPELVDPKLHDEVFYDRNELISKLSDALSVDWSDENKLIQRKFVSENYSWISVEEKYNSVLFN